MEYTYEQQFMALHNACKKAGISSHVTTINFKKDLKTHADKILSWTFRKNMPCKKTYMYCDALDMTFCFTKDGKAIYSYAGYVCTEQESENVLKAFKKANQIKKLMEKEIHKFDE